MVVFPGSNCDRDMHHVLSEFGMSPEYVWHEDGIPAGTGAVVLPGGFSYADRLRAGAIASHSPVMDDVRRLAGDGVPVLGVCNGFQILAEAGLLPGALVANDRPGFMCRWTEVVVGSTSTPFTSRFSGGDVLGIPVANGEGRYHAGGRTMRGLEEEGRIVFRYAGDLNGSAGGIAGVCSEDRNVVGMMPHPERAAETDICPPGPAPMAPLFESLRAAAAA